MLRKGLIVPLLAITLASAASTAEASRMEFNGAGGRGGIVWDSGGDVSTMNNNCSGDPQAGVPPDCYGSTLSELPDVFGLSITGLEDGFTGTAYLLVAPAPVPVTCPVITSLECLTLGTVVNDIGGTWQTRPRVGENQQNGISPTDPEQAIIRILLSQQGNFFAASPEALAFLATLNQADTHVGFDFAFTPTDPFTPFVAELTAPPTASVPEPGTLALLAIGLAGAFRRGRSYGRPAAA